MFSFPVHFLKRDVRRGNHYYFDGCHVKFIGLFVTFYHNIRCVSNCIGVLITVIKSKGKYKFHVIDMIFLFSGSYSYYEALRMKITRHGGHLGICRVISHGTGKRSSPSLGRWIGLTTPPCKRASCFHVASRLQRVSVNLRIQSHDKVFRKFKFLKRTGSGHAVA